MDLKNRAYAVLLFSMLWAALLPVLLTVGKGPAMNEFFLIVYASSIPASYLAIRMRGKTGELGNVLRDWKKIAQVAVIGVVTYFPIEYGIAFAEKYVSASLASVIIRTSPLLMLLLLPTILRERLSRYQVVALGLGFAGIYIGVTAGNLFSIFQNADAGIVLFLVAMAFVYAFSIVLIKRYMYDISIVVFISGIVMLLLVGVLFFIQGGTIYQISALQIAVAGFVGVYFNVFNFAIYFYALRPLKATVTANIFSLSPFLTFIFAAIFLGESIKIYYIAIAVLACAGIFIQSFDRKGSSYLAMSKDEGIRRMTIFDVTGVFANTGEMALNDTIKDGGRILAVKLPNSYAGTVKGIMESREYSNIYTDSSRSIVDEAKFVKDIVGAGNDEFVVMKAGVLKDGEKFFEHLHKRISLDEKTG